MKIQASYLLSKCNGQMPQLPNENSLCTHRIHYFAVPSSTTHLLHSMTSHGVGIEHFTALIIQILAKMLTLTTYSPWALRATASSRYCRDGGGLYLSCGCSQQARRFIFIPRNCFVQN